MKYNVYRIGRNASGELTYHHIGQTTQHLDSCESFRCERIEEEEPLGMHEVRINLPGEVSCLTIRDSSGKVLWEGTPEQLEYCNQEEEDERDDEESEKLSGITYSGRECSMEGAAMIDPGPPPCGFVGDALRYVAGAVMQAGKATIKVNGQPISGTMASDSGMEKEKAADPYHGSATFDPYRIDEFAYEHDGEMDPYPDGEKMESDDKEVMKKDAVCRCTQLLKGHEAGCYLAKKE